MVPKTESNYTVTTENDSPRDPAGARDRLGNVSTGQTLVLYTVNVSHALHYLSRADWLTGSGANEITMFPSQRTQANPLASAEGEAREHPETIYPTQRRASEEVCKWRSWLPSGGQNLGRHDERLIRKDIMTHHLLVRGSLQLTCFSPFYSVYAPEA